MFLEQIIYSVLFIAGIFFADFMCSLIFESKRKGVQLIFEIVLFLVVANYFLFSTLSSGNALFLGFLYFFFSFLSMLFSRVIGFLVFSRVLSKVDFFKNDLTKSNLRLANSLLSKLSKDEVVSYFKKSGFSKAFVEHLKKVLKE
ncbi:MAG: hypothetical protein PHT91_04050 [Candidatus Nanoarchaeia archaeon]|nr:hypothetical protein [Candidatus Nanoarchaeia archaeon]MDD5054282.1 hypothetical protein [Candidatus Nanoarchaeia archaeon]MDD5500017.1 hypothetical protein [Candidatus Nanoarchaeia archaeon]